MVDTPNKTSFETDEIARAALTRLMELAGMIEKDEDIIQQCGGLRLRIYEAGEYPDKNDPSQKIKYPEGIEMRCGGLRMICEASDLAMLAYHMKTNSDVKAELKRRLDEEQKIMKQLSF